MSEYSSDMKIIHFFIKPLYHQLLHFNYTMSYCRSEPDAKSSQVIQIPQEMHRAPGFLLSISQHDFSQIYILQGLTNIAKRDAR